MYKYVFLFLSNFSQAQNFTQQDSLRGNITPERTWWDVTKYNLNVQVFPKTKSICGSNTIAYKVLKPHQTLQIELQPPLVIDSIVQQKQKLSYRKKGFSYFINLVKKQQKDSLEKIYIYYQGKPKEALNAPWDGGFVWNKDNHGSDFIATANQSIGASVWWPCKDHPADEVASMEITVTCPSSLTNISNGRNTKVQKNKDNTTSYTWEVYNPINNYGVSINIADYAHFDEIYQGINGKLDCNYYVLKDHLIAAKTQFKQVPKMLKAFEYWFGPYPFYKDGYKLVETPYLGMEHQSCIAYGNKYQNGYLGYLIGDSKWGAKFDYIIIHESGHEWFANSITSKDVADLWIHESFTTYAESLYLDYYYGTKAANEYVQGLKNTVKNDKPIVGVYNVHHEGSSDMYHKGSLMLHTLRQVINNDEKWRGILTSLNKKFYHKTVTGKQIIAYINKQTDIDIRPFFEQYLTTTKIPQLILKQKPNNILYQWKNVVSNFKLPIKVYLNNKAVWIDPNTNSWQKLPGKINQLRLDENFYVEVKIVE